MSELTYVQHFMLQNSVKYGVKQTTGLQYCMAGLYIKQVTDNTYAI
jgi:hypothetical protein